MKYKQRPAVSLKETRKVLGKEAKQFNDVQVLEIINALTCLAREQLLHANPNPVKSTVRSNRNKDDNDGTEE